MLLLNFTKQTPDKGTVVIGGGGSDKIYGTEYADHLEGGEGDDTYVAGDGDIILDTDGFGRVLFEEVVLYGGVSNASQSLYISRDGKSSYRLLNGNLIVTTDAGSLTIQNFHNGDLGIFLDSNQPVPLLDNLDLKEGESKPLTLNLDRAVGERAEVYRLIVDQPDRLTLSGNGVVAIDAANGEYQITVASGATAATLTVNATAGDDNNIADAVRISVAGVLYGEDALLNDERVLQVINLNIDDSHYNPTGWQQDIGTDNRDLLPTNLTGNTYIRAGLGNDNIGNYGEMTRSYGEGGADDINTGYNYAYFDGSTIDEIADYFLTNVNPNADRAFALQWAADNRALRDAGHFNDWADGGAGNDYMFGQDGEDYLNGGGDIDYLSGGGGDDILVAGEGERNLLLGGSHNDTMVGGAGVDYILGDAHVAAELRTPGSSNDWYVTNDGSGFVFHNCYGISFGWTVRDLDGADHILAGGGNDVIYAGGMDDLVEGGDGDDYIEGNGGADRIFGGTGADRIFGAGGEQSAYNADGDDYIDAGAGNDEVEGGGGADTIYGGSGNDILVGGGDDQNLYMTPDGGDRLYGEGGDDQLFGGLGADRLDGGSGVDILSGEAGDDLLFGGANDDRLFGGDGDDFLSGEADNDELQGGIGNDILYGDSGADNLYGEAGEDTLYGGSENDFLWGGADNDIMYGGTHDDELHGDGGDDRLFGEAGADRLSGGDGDDFLDGGTGRDGLLGGAGNDILIGGAENDHLDGGAGNDTYYLDLASGDDVIADHSGVNTLDFASGILLENIQVSHVISPTGVLYNALIYGSNAMVFVHHEASTVGMARVDGGASTAIAGILQQVEGDYATAAPTGGALEGGVLGDRLIGGAGNDAISGGLGDDWLEGGANDDVLSGGNGADVLLGGSGFDRLFGNRGDDYLDGGSGGAILTGGDGNDTFVYTEETDDLYIDEADYYTGDNDRLVMHEGLLPSEVIPWRVGNDLRLYVRGGEDVISITNHFASATSGIDRLLFADGTVWDRSYFTDEVLQQGVDIFTGTAGDDSYTVDHIGDSIVESPNGGLDTVYSSVRYTLPENVENLVLEGDRSIDGYGNAQDNRITGNSGDNQLDGITAATAGGDILVGGAGDDTYWVREADDVQIIENAGEGTDTMICHDLDGCTLPANVENLTMDPGRAFTYNTVWINGNELDNIIVGFVHMQNHIDGGAGADEMWGGTGNDWYHLDNPGDVVHDFSGVDTLYIHSGYTTDTTYRLSEDSGFENVSFWDMTMNEVHGNSVNNEISGANIVYGYGGADDIRALQVAYGGDDNDTISAPVVYGGLGNDTISNADTVYYQLGDGRDYVNDAVHLILEGGISLQDVDFAAVPSGSYRDYRINFADGGSVTLDTGYAGSETRFYQVEFAVDGVVINGSDFHVYVRDVKTVGTDIADNLELTGLSNLAYGLEGNDRIKGSDERYADNTLVGGAGNDELIGGAWNAGVHWGDNWLFGGQGDDRLVAGTGENYLYGGMGADILEAATGGQIDRLYGGTGNDEYVIMTADGDVTIYDDASEQNRLRFESAIDFDSLGFQTLGGHLHIHTSGTGQVRIWDWDTGHAVRQIVFADGTTLADTDIAALEGRLLRVSRSVLTDRTLAMFVNEYNDPEVDAATIPIQDRWIEIDSGITPDALVFERVGDDLTIRVNDQTVVLTVSNWFRGHDDRYKFPRLVFMDGGEMLLDAIEQNVVFHGTIGDDVMSDYRGHDDTMLAGAGADTLTGGLGNDTLFGEAGNDTLYGGSGDDRLRGGAGNDTYVFAEGEGHDVIDGLNGGVDTISLLGNLTLDRLSYTQEGLDLLIQVDDGTSQTIRVVDHFSASGIGIDQIVAEDGSTHSAAGIAALLPGGQPPDPNVYDTEIIGNAGDNQLSGTNGADLISGEGGADTLFGFHGNDKLIGGAGNDYLSGGNGSNDPADGDDHLLGGDGNDTLFGEGGNDLLEGGIGDDKYNYKAGGGQDTIDNSGGGFNGLFFLDVTSDRLSYHQEGNDLLVLVDGDLQQQVRVVDHFLDAEHAIGYVQPNGGFSITPGQIASMLTPLPGGGGDGTVPEVPPPTFEPPNPADYDQVVTGSAVGEQVVGSSLSDYLDALAGDDQLFGLGGNDALLGGAGADYLDGGAGDDLQFGGDGADQLGGDAGNDRLRGGLGDDIYVYRPNSGADIIDNSDGGVDWLIFTDTLTADRLSYYRSGDDLIVRVDNDANQQVTVQSWYAGNPLSYIQPAGGNGIPASQIESMAGVLTAAQRGMVSSSTELAVQHEQLVWAMAGFTGGEGAEALISRVDEQPESVMLAVSSMN